MKRDFITEQQAEEMGLIYIGICHCTDKSEKNKKIVINLAAKEEEESNIPCYPVMGEGNMTVYAEPIYNKRREYYRNINGADSVYSDLLKAGRMFADFMHQYDTFISEAKKLEKELVVAGVKI